MAVRRWLPNAWRAQLWGDRERWGLVADRDDPDWREWQATALAFYGDTQRTGVGTVVNDAGYRVMRRVPLAGQRVLEIGAGDIRHARWWRDKPAAYTLADVSAGMAEKAAARLRELGVDARVALLERNAPLPLASGSVDVVVSFYSLEHLYPLGDYLQEMIRVLRPGGLLVGAIPTEGGLAWGVGRWLTSRRWLKRNPDIDPDKLICWEHPNFAETVLAELDARFTRVHVSYWPWRVPLVDPNLVTRFVYQRA